MNNYFILDSGAFSADSKGTPVDLDKYMDFIEANKVHQYFNLDVIGDCEATWENQKVMEDNGFKPIPVYHADDPVKYLNRCIKGYEYFALGGMAGGVSEQTRQRFLDKCWEIICPAPSYLPINKVHGLGLASPLLIARYPWYSVDTASGIHYGRYGIIIIPRKKPNGQPDYLSPPYSLYITERSTAQKVEGKHIKNVSHSTRDWIFEYIKSRGFEFGKVEFSYVKDGYKLKENETFVRKGDNLVERVVEEGIVSNGVLRDYFNIDFYMMMEKAIPEWPWPFRIQMKRLF